MVEIYDLLYGHYGDLGWWPANNEDEIVIGAVLTQNTSWKNVEIALKHLREKQFLGIKEIYRSNEDDLREAIRSAGFYNRKARTLKLLSEGIIKRFGSVDGMRRMPDRNILDFLESIHGIGAETRDDILLYALDLPVFIVDGYTKRIFARFMGQKDVFPHLSMDEPAHKKLGLDVMQLKNLHAMLVHTAKDYCHKKPLCINCPLKIKCAFAQE